MNLLLNRFSYYFTMEDKQGGLFSTEWHFLPAPDAARDEAGMEAALGIHVDMLDRVFASVLSGKRAETLSDIPGRRHVGYRYRGILTPWRAPGPPPSREAVRSGGGGTELKVTHRLGHAVNACLFRHLRACGGFGASAEAEFQTRALEELLGDLEKGRLAAAPRSLPGA